MGRRGGIQRDIYYADTMLAAYRGEILSLPDGPGLKMRRRAENLALWGGKEVRFLPLSNKAVICTSSRNL